MPKVKCPECGSTNTVQMTTGDYDYIAEHHKRLKHDVDAGKVVLTGCLPSEHNRLCRECKSEFDTPTLAREKRETGFDLYS